MHLYFLPMLLLGSYLDWAFSPSIRKFHLVVLIILLGISVFSYYLLCVAGNSYSIAHNMGFIKAFGAGQSFLPRLFLALAAWAIRLTPYLLLAEMLRRLTLQNLSHRASVYASVLFVSFFVFELFYALLPSAIHEIAEGALLLSLCLSIRSFTPVFNGLFPGRFMFAVYLSHIVFVQFVQLIALAFGFGARDVGIFYLLAMAVASFVSCLLVCIAVTKLAPGLAYKFLGVSGADSIK